jgi:hypothetical protein
MIPGVGAAASQALPAVPSTALPAEVRQGSADDRKAYAAALGFEKILLGRLAQAMTDSMGESSGSEGPAREMMGEALADSVTSGGGTGLALDLYRDMRPEDLR